MLKLNLAFWLEQRGNHGSPSQLSQASACLAVSLLIPHLIMNNPDLVFTMLDRLIVGLPGVTASERQQDSPLVQLHHALGLGLFLAGLHRQRFMDVAGPQVTGLKCKAL